MSKIFEALSKSGIAYPEVIPELALAVDATIEPEQHPEPEAADLITRLETAVPGDAPFLAMRTATLNLRPDSPVLPFDDCHWGASEQYRIIRTRILHDPRNSFD